MTFPKEFDELCAHIDCCLNLAALNQNCHTKLEHFPHKQNNIKKLIPVAELEKVKALRDKFLSSVPLTINMHNVSTPSSSATVYSSRSKRIKAAAKESS